uniref:MPL proto-onco, thrombopoietin receptor n=1 Tax=Anas platyrhynchos platyrhynchos TaxID=8840 RepID=A0A493T0S0_ANAPP
MVVACLPRGWLPVLLAVVLLSLRSPTVAPELVTSQDAALLEEVREDILCFSRSFEDLTCFWDEEEEASGMSHFYYWYSRDVPTACAVSTQRREAGGTRHVCAFPSQDVRLFTQLHVLVLDAATNQTRHQRELSVDVVGLIGPPVNISARWAGATGQVHVSWQTPLPDYPNFFLYEVRYSAVSPHSMAWDPSKQHTGDPRTPLSSSTHTPTAGGAAVSPQAGQDLVLTNTWVVLQHLRPGVRYHIQVRTKPDGTSMDGVWGPWSQAVAAETPHSSGDIGLCCSTPDLQHVRCEWSWDPAEHSSSHELFYQETPRGAGIREDMWQRCEEASVGTQGAHSCTFQPSNASAIAVLLNVTRPHGLPGLSYFQDPFWLHQAVLTEAPQLVEAAVAQGQLSLQWLPPLEQLAEQLDYQVRYTAGSSPDWKVLQVPRAARGQVLDLRPGARYRAQVRARPVGPRYRGSWSAWSEPVAVDASPDAGKGRGRGPGAGDRGRGGAWGSARPTAAAPRGRLGRAERHAAAAGDRGGAAGAALRLPRALQVRTGREWGAGGGQRGQHPVPARPCPAGPCPPRPPLPAPSTVKQRLWPPVPDLQRALGSFLHDSGKQGQVRGGEGLGLSPPGSPQPGPPQPCRPPPAGAVQAAGGGGGAALPAGGAARPRGRPDAASAGAHRRPAAAPRRGAQHGHRQPVLPARQRLGAARAALSRPLPINRDQRCTASPPPPSFAPPPSATATPSCPVPHHPPTAEPGGRPASFPRLFSPPLFPAPFRAVPPMAARRAGGVAMATGGGLGLKGPMGGGGGGRGGDLKAEGSGGARAANGRGGEGMGAVRGL